MWYIYREAYVLFAATRSSDCFQGFLQERRGAWLQDGEMLRESIVLRARVIRNHHVAYDWVAMNRQGLPLFTRVWCFQERLLARRIVYFFPDEAAFVCHTAQERECGLSTYQIHKCAESASIPSHPSFWSISKRKRPDQDITGWDLEKYNRASSTLKLTKGSDSVPALSGIARSFRKLHLFLGNYLAGMWQAQLAKILTWTRGKVL